MGWLSRRRDRRAAVEASIAAAVAAAGLDRRREDAALAVVSDPAWSATLSARPNPRKAQP